jgi:hypothetical protein
MICNHLVGRVVDFSTARPTEQSQIARVTVHLQKPGMGECFRRI